MFADEAALSQFIKHEYNIDFSGRSMYQSEKGIIYVSLTDMTAGMLGYEIAHAIISHYFVVPPPARVQDVLCGYVEYSLQKSHSSLP